MDIIDFKFEDVADEFTLHEMRIFYDFSVYEVTQSQFTFFSTAPRKNLSLNVYMPCEVVDIALIDILKSKAIKSEDLTVLFGGVIVKQAEVHSLRKESHMLFNGLIV